MSKIATKTPATTSKYSLSTSQRHEAHFLELLAADPKNTLLLHRLAKLLASRGSHIKALMTIEAARSVDSENVDLIITECRILINLHRYVDAWDIATAIKHPNPREVDVQSLLNEITTLIDTASAATSAIPKCNVPQLHPNITESIGVYYHDGAPFIEGWCFDHTQPNQRAVINLHADSTALASEPATMQLPIIPRYLPDNCGFRWRIPDRFLDNQNHKITAIGYLNDNMSYQYHIYFRHGAIYGTVVVTGLIVHVSIVPAMVADDTILINVRIDSDCIGILALSTKDLSGIDRNIGSRFAFKLPTYLADGGLHQLQLSFADKISTFYPSTVEFSANFDSTTSDIVTDDNLTITFLEMPATLLRDIGGTAEAIQQRRLHIEALKAQLEKLKGDEERYSNDIAFSKRHIEKSYGEAQQSLASDFNRYIEHLLFFNNVTKTYLTQLDYSPLLRKQSKATFPSIDENGANITILVLSFHRVSYTLRMLWSIYYFIPNFRGEVLLFDNGSHPDELERLKQAVNTLPFSVTIIENGTNLGIGPARSEAAKFIKTDWFLSIDNDIYFVKSPFSALRDVVNATMAHFINLPLLTDNCLDVFAFGGSIYIRTDNNNNPYIVQGPSLKRFPYWDIRDDQWFLSNFIFGGAALYRTATFLELGGFDKHMKVGFEDTEFSLRVLQSGLKVANISSQCLVHAHGSVTTFYDLFAEKVRFSSDAVMRSAERFQELYDLPIHPKEEVEAWLELRLKEVGEKMTPEVHVQTSLSIKDLVDLPKIAVIIDQYNGPFHRIARLIQEQLSGTFTVEIHKSSDFSCLDNALMNLSYCNCLHIIHRGFALSGRDGLRALRTVKSFRDGILNLLDDKIITLSVFDHLFIDEDYINTFGWVFRGLVEQYTVSSPALYNIYDNISAYYAQPWMIPDGVDTVLFKPVRKGWENGIARNNNKALSVGWVGNSQWGNWPGHNGSPDHKGLHNTIRPAIEELKADGFNIVENFVDSSVNPRPYANMPEYYHEIDLLICGSVNEGTPNPVLEAMASGVPVISTDVGIVSSVFGPLQKSFIFPFGDKDVLKSLLIKLMTDDDLRKKISLENLSSIQSFSVIEVGKMWRSFFQSAFERKQISKNTGSKRGRSVRNAILMNTMFERT